MRLALLIFAVVLFSQSRAQSAFSLDSVGTGSKSESNYNRKLFGDSLSSSFCIVIKKEVKAHKHATHSEHVYVVEGDGAMKLAEKTFTIKKGDMIFIPKNTVHSVKTLSKVPLKVISIQSPLFDGTDRIMME